MEILQKINEYQIGGFSAAKVIKAVLLLLVCILVMKLLGRFVDSFLAKSKLDKNLHTFIRSVAGVIMWFITIIIVVDSLGIPVASLLAVFSVAGLAASLAMQDTLSNIASGVLLLITRPFRVGNFIECEGASGVVQNISLVYTQIRTLDNKIIYIPNKDVSSGKITNFSKQPFRRIDLEFTASYDCPVEAVKMALLEAAGYVPTVSSEPEPPFVSVADYGNSSIAYILKVWCKTPNYWTTYYGIKEAVKKSFDKNSIVMTYDHLNVHIDKD